MSKLQSGEFALELLRSLNFHRKLALRTMLRMVGWFTADEIYKQYSLSSWQYGIKPVGLNTFRHYLLELFYWDLLESKKEGKRRYYRLRNPEFISLAFDKLYPGWGK